MSEREREREREQVNERMGNIREHESTRAREQKSKRARE